MFMNEELFCKYLLSLRKRKYSVLRYYKRKLTVLLPLLSVMASAGYFLLKDSGYDSLCILTIGLGFGILLRDFYWLRNIKKSWPLKKRITDWKLVNRIAGGQAANE